MNKENSHIVQMLSELLNSEDIRFWQALSILNITEPLKDNNENSISIYQNRKECIVYRDIFYDNNEEILKRVKLWTENLQP